ncbi:MAG TPA: hypothetical protein VF594_03680 [Rubricoccaceae bacterium]|jgi:hypothetical protein
MPRPVRLVLILAVGLLAAFVLRDVLGLGASETGVVSPKGYVAISHGSHTHYVPNGWSGDPDIHSMPTTAPAPGMTVAMDGSVVPAE